MAPITFYHFTRKKYALVIFNEGLRKGDVPISPSTGFNAVWLFSTPDPRYYSFFNSPDLTDEKRGIRITLKLDSEQDPNLKKWTEVAREYKVDPHWYSMMNVGEKHGSDLTSWLYRGKITPDKFISVGIKKDGIRNLDYTEYTDIDAALTVLMTEGGQKMFMYSMFMEGYPEPETGWPARKEVDRSCSNPACATTTKKLLECAVCHRVQYCSKACQKIHWKAVHRIKCNHFRETVAAGGTAPMKTYIVNKGVIL